MKVVDVVSIFGSNDSEDGPFKKQLILPGIESLDTITLRKRPLFDGLYGGIGNEESPSVRIMLIVVRIILIGSVWLNNRGIN